jgi:hypothetical protein
MYPDRELTGLAARKAALRWDIALRRVQCAEAAARVAQPLAWLDRMLAFWRQLSPLAQFAAVPLGFLIKRAVFPRRKVLRSLVRWGPLVFGALRAITSVVKNRVESSKFPGDRSRRPFARPHLSRTP